MAKRPVPKYDFKAFETAKKQCGQDARRAVRK